MSQAHYIKLDLTNCTTQELKDEQGALFSILMEREKAFGFNPKIITEYPDTIDDFLDDPCAFMASRVAAVQKEKGVLVKEIVILTTYGNKVFTALTSDNYVSERIEMPAGPDHTYKFSKTLDSSSLAEHSYYFEAVDEQDEKINPTFVIKQLDQEGRLIGGMSGSIRTAEDQSFAYISTVVVREGSPKSTGFGIANETIRYLKSQGVKHADLGTQTADAFYKKLGFCVTHNIIDDLRHRVDMQNKVVQHDLVIMRIDL